MSRGILSRRLVVAFLAVFFLLPALSALAAAPTVVTVPWRGLLDIPHDTYNGKQIFLKGVAHGVVMPGATATWDPGDGSALKVVTPNPDATGFDFDLGVTHTYPNSSAGTPYVATLTVCNGSECASDTYRVVVKNRTLDVEINIGIDEGLWFSHRAQTRNASSTDGGWFSQGDTTPTAASVQAFQINNHFETNPSNQDPYADTVARGLKFLLSRLRAVAIGVQIYGDPEAGQASPNRLGIESPNNSPIYETGSVMDVIVSSKTPGAFTTTGPNGAALPANIGGRTYKEIVQDMVDMYAWGQYDSASVGGGWRYSWNSHPDNSACQWAAIGILAARDLFGCTVPTFVYERNLVWLSYSQTPAPPSAASGYGYTGRGEGVALSPSGLVQLIMDGIPSSDATRWVGVENRMAQVWNSWYRDTTNYYALFALSKVMRLALPAPIVQMSQGTASQIDWFGADCANPASCNSSTDKWGVARTLLRDQNSNGQFVGGAWTSGPLSHAWGVIMLTGTLEVPPVAVATANPNPGADGLPIAFDGSGSYHTDPAKSIVLYEWDFDNDGIFDVTGVTASHAFACPSLPCTYPVALKVTDNGTPAPLIDTDTISVSITVPPHPPTADADGPYLACVDEQVQLDGSGSFDVDEPMGDSITAYGWELDFTQPLDFNDAVAVSPTTTYATAGLHNIGLRVTDDSANLYSPSPDLTDDDFTTVRTMDCSCIVSFTARPKSGEVQLVWSPVGGATSYDIYRSTVGPNAGFALVAAGHVTTYATYLDTGLTNGTVYWYRIDVKDVTGGSLCGSAAVSATPLARVRALKPS